MPEDNVVTDPVKPLFPAFTVLIVVSPVTDMLSEAAVPKEILPDEFSAKLPTTLVPFPILVDEEAVLMLTPLPPDVTTKFGNKLAPIKLTDGAETVKVPLLLVLLELRVPAICDIVFPAVRVIEEPFRVVAKPLFPADEPVPDMFILPVVAHNVTAGNKIDPALLVVMLFVDVK